MGHDLSVGCDQAISGDLTADVGLSRTCDSSASVFVSEVLPTDEELAFYEENGWLLTQLFVKDEYLEACKAAAEEVYSGQYDQMLPWSTHRANVGFGEHYVDRSRSRMDVYVSHHKSAVRQVVCSPHLGAYAAALMRTTEVRLYRDMLLTMPARLGHNTGLHVDKNYWPTCSSERLTSAWFPLSDCGENEGCLVVVSGSHRWPATTFVKKIDLRHADQLQQIYGRVAEGVQMQAVPHKRGQISFHSCRLVHGSLPNRGEQARQSFAIVLQDRDNRYVPPPDAATARLAAFNTNDRIGPVSADGYPNYSDYSFYPLLYGAGVGGAEGGRDAASRGGEGRADEAFRAREHKQTELPEEVRS